MRKYLKLATSPSARWLLLTMRVAIPRSIRPLVTCMLTRRCYQRTFRLRPSAESNQIFLYSLAWAAAKTGVLIHAACVMSNHRHIVLTDVRGALSDFARELHRTVAKALNAAQGQWENLWSAEQYHSLELGSDEDVIDKIAYIASNPTEAGLVESPEEWPGVMLLPEGEGKTLEIQRPGKYFANSSVFPEKVMLRVVPMMGRQLSREAISRRLGAAIKRAVARAREAVIAAGGRFLGRQVVLGQSFQKRAESYEPKRGPIPQVRARNRTLLKAILARYAEFQVRYREALDAWRGGDRGVVFPFGTWAMRLVHGAVVAQGPGYG
ncbi:transposase [Polyangium jinanense]|uniref:Transposase n=1 Tax=Polyangium jinanense TaxID=2829994 RepID=A0A9X3X2G8_9BACT|nr:transposase [Polyangium jinanense]MDC3955158.1 transposase [Polyangium jinanense]MDC3981073.1 transposase [Polyangium jinanense]